MGQDTSSPANKAIEEEKEKNGQKLKGVYRRRERVKRGREEGEKNNAAHAPPRRFSLVFSLFPGAPKDAQGRKKAVDGSKRFRIYVFVSIPRSASHFFFLILFQTCLVRLFRSR